MTQSAWKCCSKVFLDRRVEISDLNHAFFSQTVRFCMISSMTGYGRGEARSNRFTVTAEVRSVNSRFLEVASRLPRSLAVRENDVKELVRTKLVRGKVNVSLSLSQTNSVEIPLRVNASAAKAYFKLLTELKRTMKLREKITLDHLLKFPELLETEDGETTDEEEWTIATKALVIALDEAVAMRQREGRELLNDLATRIRNIETTLTQVEQLSTVRLPQERARMAERVQALLSDRNIVDHNRLELEIALLGDKLDITEECVRFRAHNKFFLHGLQNEEAAGRKLNFLTQEMNREANTIGSKANDAEIAHLVVSIKDELEKTREQLQNIE